MADFIPGGDQSTTRASRSIHSVIRIINRYGVRRRVGERIKMEVMSYWVFDEMVDCDGNGEDMTRHYIWIRRSKCVDECV